MTGRCSTQPVSAAANKTIDDLEPHTHYNDIARINKGCCVVQALSGETAEFGVDSTQVDNGTVSRIVQNTIPADFKLMQMEINFTADAPGAGLYLYFAHDGGSGGATDFFLNNVLVGNFSVELDPRNTKPTYNILGYANSSIPPGNHTVGMRLTRGVMYFDYAIVKSSSVPSSDLKHNKVPVAVIVGGSIGGIAVVLEILAGLLCSRARGRKGIATAAIEELPPPAPVWQPIPHDNHPAAIDPVATQRIQPLEEKVRRLTKHAEGSRVNTDFLRPTHWCILTAACASRRGGWLTSCHLVM
ncbi:hypothetical protein C8R43DRAFT_1139318 [Mycena crocata]|nr:hypothetical protein C8R43DRAFT_1139318 [Mycena crocata]